MLAYLQKDKSILVRILALFRPLNLLMAAANMWLFRWFIFLPFLQSSNETSLLSDMQFALLCLIVIAVMISGYWINDYADLATDRINQPKRLLVQHRPKPSVFYGSWTILNLLGLVVGVVLGRQLNQPAIPLIYLLGISSFVLYAYHLKPLGLAGNVLVSIWIAFIPWFIYIAEWRSTVSISGAALQLLLLYTALMFFSNMARELVKDIEDIDGDERAGMHTLPILKGPTFVAGMSAAMLLLGILSLLLFLWLNAKEIEILAPLFSPLIIMGGVLSARIPVLINKGQANRASLYLKIYMMVGIVLLPLLEQWWPLMAE